VAWPLDYMGRAVPESAAAADSRGDSGAGGGGGGDWSPRCLCCFVGFCFPFCCWSAAGSVGSAAAAGASTRACSSPLWLAISVDAVSSVNQSRSRNTVLKRTATRAQVSLTQTLSRFQSISHVQFYDKAKNVKNQNGEHNDSHAKGRN